MMLNPESHEEGVPKELRVGSFPTPSFTYPTPHRFEDTGA